LSEYSPDLQKLFLEMMIEDAQAYVRVQDIYNVENFDRSLHKPAKFMQEHAADHNALPTREQIKAKTGVSLEAVPDIGEEHFDWFFKEFEGFTRQKELSRAILEAADLIESGDYDPIEKMIKDAVQISLTKNLGTNYFEDPRARLMKLKDSNGQNSTGWPTLDRRLYGGFNKGELNIFAGGSGSGKSLFMQNIAVNWMQKGLNGVYITLELAEELCAMRIDSMVANYCARDIFRNIDEIEMKVKAAGKKSGGGLQIKYMDAQSNVNHIRAYLKELQIRTGKKVNFLMIDYLDLLMPVSAKVSPSDLFIKDKYVSEELRNLAKELDILFITASQLNRSAVDEIDFDHSMISGGISKINTADNLFGILTNRSMKERGVYQLQLMKTRSSSGVGQRIELGFDVETMRITDLGEDAQDHGSEPPSDIMKKIKSRANGDGVKEAEPMEPMKINDDTKRQELKDMISKLNR